MGELRKDFCSICGFVKHIVEVQELKLAPPKHGTREIKLCEGCQIMRDSQYPQNRLIFEKDYAFAARGTIGLVAADATKPPVPSAPVGLGSMSLPNMPKGVRKAPKEPTDDIDADLRRLVAIRWFVRGVGLTLIVSGALLFATWTFLRSMCGF